MAQETSNASVKIGNRIPNFFANDEDGQLWSLHEHLDKGPVVLYFYPAAMTGGCTKQACSYRDALSHFEKLDVTVVGISGDPVKNLKWFSEAHGLNFKLLSDVNAHIARLFGLEMKPGGSVSQTINDKDVVLKRPFTFSRWTFVLDSKGEIVYLKKGVNPAEDSEDILNFLKNRKI